MTLGFTRTFGTGKGKKTDFERKILEGVKIHTVRHDGTGRWKEGRKIHFATGARSSRYNCFKEGKCLGVQDITIANRMVFIDEEPLNWEEFLEFVKNDGFDNEEDFWLWFDQYTPFRGKVIHWTNKLY